MISYDAILQQLEKQLVEAKNAITEQQLRESLTAVRALCDVVLAAPVREANTVVHKQPVPQLSPAASTQQMLQATKLEEDDANGDSIFDF